MCAATLAGIPGALGCTREQGHVDGHVFIVDWLADRHDQAEAVQW
jgi:hypothetical protein